MAKGAVCFGTFFFVVVVSLVGYGVEGKLPDIGECSFKNYTCSERECYTMFFEGLQKNPNDCSGAFLTLRSCMKNVLKICFGSSLNDEQLEVFMDASFREEQFCTDGLTLEVPTAAPGTVLPCTQNFASAIVNCQKPFYEKFRSNKADTQLCSSYADAKQCLRNAVKVFCAFTRPMTEILDVNLDDYNPFCDNDRDPGATGPGYCGGVAVTPSSATAPGLTAAGPTAAGLTAKPAFGAFVVLIGAASIGHFLIW